MKWDEETIKEIEKIHGKFSEDEIELANFIINLPDKELERWINIRESFEKDDNTLRIFINFLQIKPKRI